MSDALTLEEQVDMLHEAVHLLREELSEAEMACVLFFMPHDAPCIVHGVTEICGVPIVLNPASELDLLFEDV